MIMMADGKRKSIKTIVGILLTLLISLSAISSPINGTEIKKETINLEPTDDVTIDSGSITVQHINPHIILKAQNNYLVDVKYEGYVTIEVDYVIDCYGLFNYGEAGISFTDGSDSDTANTEGYKKGFLRIKRYCEPFDTFKIKLCAKYKYTDLTGEHIIEDEIKANVTITRAPRAFIMVLPSSFYSTDCKPNRPVSFELELRNYGDIPLNWCVKDITSNYGSNWRIEPNGDTGVPPWDQIQKYSIYLKGTLPRRTLSNPYPITKVKVTLQNIDLPDDTCTINAKIYLKRIIDDRSITPFSNFKLLEILKYL